MQFLPLSSLWAGCFSALLLGQAASAIKLDLNDADSIKDASKTLAYGMMKYYQGNETGKPVGLLPDPYYWWEAGAMFGVMIEYWYYTGDDTYNDVVMEGLLAQVGPDNDYMPPNQTKTEGNDDQAFWAFATMSAAELKFPNPPKGKPSWLALSQAVFNLQASRWDTADCGGGLRWQIFTWNRGYDYKNSISNGGFFQLAARLARYTGNETYAKWADKSYDWIVQTPLFTKDYHIYDGAQIENNCTIATKNEWTYNIGTFLMGAANMYNYTNGDRKWRDRVDGIMKGTDTFFPKNLGGNVMSEVACEPGQTCNNDQPSFKAYLSRWMAATTQLCPWTFDAVKTRLTASANGAAGQCVGGTDGETCGRSWGSNTWDGKYGVGEEMSALSVVQSNLISKVKSPVTTKTGGDSEGDPSAGSQGDHPNTVVDPNAHNSITTSDRAGAGILTALVLITPIAWSAESTTAPSSVAAARRLRIISPHLVPQQGRSETPEPPSSPSATTQLSSIIDSSEVESKSSAVRDKREGAPAQVAARVRAGEYRSASPAKRGASIMSGKDSEDVDMNSARNPNDGGSEGSDSSKSVKMSPQDVAGAGQRAREASVDMLNDGSGQTSLYAPQNPASSLGAKAIQSKPEPDIPSLEEQVRQVSSFMRTDWMKEGVKGYAIATKWLGRVLSRSSENTDTGKYGKDAREGPVGPVDNSSLWLDVDANALYQDEKGEEFVFMKPGLMVGEDYEMVPQEAWDLIIKWYGKAEGSPIITRYCHNTSTSDVQEHLQWEQSPPIFTVLKLPDTSQGMSQKDIKERDARPVKLLASRSERFQTFLKRAKHKANIDIKTKVRVWRISGGLEEKEQEGMLTPAQSRSNSPAPGVMPAVDPGNKLVLDVNTFAQLQLGSERELLDAKDETENPNYNGKSTLGFHGLSSDGVYVLEERVGGPAGGEWVSDASTAKIKTNGVPISITNRGSTTVKDTLNPNAATSRGTSPTPGGMMTRGRHNKAGRTRGTVGLGNLGNTCYMNSALQCVRSVKELTEYFLRDKFKAELNPSNPLSHNGDVAKTYAKLLKEIYDEKQISSFTPRVFKNIVGKYGPSFSGYQQQDSQEFLLFLLDGLQEDLNRIHKKPYIEKPDSTDAMVNDPAALRDMADQCWDIYKKRNDSVITDLFAGMYKSTLVCPHCQKVSIIFDPFNNLTLQLPIQNIWSKDVWVFPLRAAPFRLAIDIDKNSAWSTLAEYIAKKLSLGPEKLVMAEVWQHKLYKFFEPRKSINEDNVTDADIIGCFEIEDKPTNWPSPKKKKQQKSFYNYSSVEDDVIPEADSPMADRMLVSVFHRRSKGVSRYSTTEQKELFGVPSLMIVTREEARDYQAILKKCLSRAENLTTKDFLREDEGNPAQDSDTVILNVEDSSDGKVQAESLESEDGMVEVSMEDEKNQTEGTKHQLSFHRKPPAQLLKPESSLPSALQDLFDIKIYSTGTEMVPLGPTQFMADDDKNLTSLASREAALPLRDPHEEAPTAGKHQQRLLQVDKKNSPPTSDEDEDLPPAAPIPAVADASDSDGLPEIEQIVQAPIPAPSYGAGKGRNSTIKTVYAKKDKRRAKPAHFRRESSSHGTEADPDQPLLRLGECLILDWNDEGFDAMFGASVAVEDEEGPSRGMPTWEGMEMLPDPELEENRRVRTVRKKHGFSLGDCLDEFGKPETLSENDAWYCPRCKEHRRASKKFELWKAPDVLVIHLKRFSAQGRFNNKLDVMVDFPLEGLDLTTRLATSTPEGKPPIYELFAVDNHYGGLGGGHYTAYAKNFIDMQWYEYNDSSVTRKRDESVITSAAYLLFYRRQSETTLGGPFFEQMASSSPLPSQSNSRVPSPSAGEGKRLGDSSRNGLSSASHGVGAGHQAGDGGQASPTVMTDGDELPSYSTAMRGGDNSRKDLDDLDEGIGMDDDPQTHYGVAYGPHMDTQWSFNTIDDMPRNGSQIRHLPPPNSDADEDEESRNAASNFSGSANDRMAEFVDDEGTTMGPFGTPPQHDTVEMDEPWGEQSFMYEDEPVAEVRIDEDMEDNMTEERGATKMD